MAKKRTINIRNLFDSWPSVKNGQCCITFENEKNIVRIHFDRCWIEYIADNLWEIIKKEREELIRMEKALKNEE